MLVFLVVIKQAHCFGSFTSHLTWWIFQQKNQSCNGINKHKLHYFHGSVSVYKQLRTYPSPNPTLTLTRVRGGVGAKLPIIFTIPSMLSSKSKFLPPHTWSLDISSLLSWGRLPRIKPEIYDKGEQPLSIKLYRYSKGSFSLRPNTRTTTKRTRKTRLRSWGWI